MICLMVGFHALGWLDRPGPAVREDCRLEIPGRLRPAGPVVRQQAVHCRRPAYAQGVQGSVGDCLEKPPREARIVLQRSKNTMA